MDFIKKIKTYLEKLQALEEKRKKIILWSIVAILALIMGFLWVRSVANKVPQISQNIQNINIQELK
jgi:hypothetical protein